MRQIGTGAPNLGKTAGGELDWGCVRNDAITFLSDTGLRLPLLSERPGGKQPA